MAIAVEYTAGKEKLKQTEFVYFCRILGRVAGFHGNSGLRNTQNRENGVPGLPKLQFNGIY